MNGRNNTKIGIVLLTNNSKSRFAFPFVLAQSNGISTRQWAVRIWRLWKRPLGKRQSKRNPVAWKENVLTGSTGSISASLGSIVFSLRERYIRNTPIPIEIIPPVMISGSVINTEIPDNINNMPIFFWLIYFLNKIYFFLSFLIFLNKKYYPQKSRKNKFSIFYMFIKTRRLTESCFVWASGDVFTVYLSG